MRIELVGEPAVIQSNPHSLHHYFGWPTAARLKDGTIAVGSSGFRLKHICPFGKAVLSFSRDEGNTYTAPAVVIDTPLDDRDVGLTPFGKSGLLVTSFNNTIEFQRTYANAYASAYLDTVTPLQEQTFYGSQFRISQDNGVTFGPIFHSPVTSPHGPIELANGQLLWVGRTFGCGDFSKEDRIKAYRIYLDGTTELLGAITPITEDGTPLMSCEPHALQLPDGTILCHLRVQDGTSFYTTYQSESADGGKTWTKPHAVLSKKGGAPAHLLLHSSGTVISTYGYREEPYGIRAMFSFDGGKTWDADHILYEKGTSGDLGYPSTIETADGSLLTVFYAHVPSAEDPAVILQQKWRFIP